MANLKLTQVNALLRTAKGEGEGALTRAYHLIQKPAPLAGLIKTYAPRTETGEELPPEGVTLQVRIEDVLDGIITPLSRLLDLTATLDAANQMARADVVVDGEVILAAVPVTTLLMLERKLTDLHTFLSKVPVLDPAEKWVWDDNSRNWRTEPSKKARTNKVPTNHVKAVATEKHAAQVEILYLDQAVGDWSTTLLSGALSESRRGELLEKVTALRNAVKIAREQANLIEAPDVKIGAKLFEFLGW